MLGLERRFAGDLVAEGGWRVEKEPEACGRELPCEGEPGAPTVPDGSSNLLPELLTALVRGVEQEVRSLEHEAVVSDGLPSA